MSCQLIYTVRKHEEGDPHDTAKLPKKIAAPKIMNHIKRPDCFKFYLLREISIFFLMLKSK